MARANLKRLIDKIDSLPTLPGVVVRLIQLTQSDDSDATAIARVIESDQTLTAQILRLVNGSSYNFASQITTVSRAVAAVGFNTIRCIALGMGVAKLFPDAGGSAFPLKEFWKHSLACAVAAEMVASKSTQALDKDEAFVAGLLHDIGKVALATCYAEGYDAAVNYAHEHGTSLLDAERQILGIDHCEGGKWLAERWGLPDTFVQAIWLHHQSPAALSTAGFQTGMVLSVQVADSLARQLMIGFSGNEQIPAITDAQHTALGLDKPTVTDIQSRLCRRVEEYALVIDLDLDETGLYIESLQKANMELSRISLKFEEQNRRLELRGRRLRALNEMNGLLGPDQSLGDVLTILSESLRDGFAIRTGMCYVANTGNRSIYGRLWKKGGAPQEFEIALDADGPISGANNVDAGIRALLQENVLRFDGDTWLGQQCSDVLRRQDLFIVPMMAEGKSVGQILLDFRSEEKAPAGDLGMSEILTFAAAGGLAISRVHMYEMLRRRSEELAAAMWKMEQTHKQLLHSERLAAVGKMAAGAAHEINNPLAIISGRAQIMLQRETGDANRKALRLIVDQCARASKILNDLMGFARPALPKKEITGINTVVLEVVNMFENRYESHGIALKCNYAENLPRVLVDRGQIQQVLVNLLINADHAITPPGTVTIVTGLNAARSKVVLSVSDTGCGIPYENLQQIFEPFFTTKEEGQGTGLGLSLAHSIIQGHNGTITVKSKVGEGTTFAIALPVATDVESMPKEERGVQRSEHRPKTKSKRVLVVDDEEQVRAVISEALITAGYEVEQADNGLVAMEMFQRKPFDLVTLDIRMPRMDGMAVLRALRQRGPDIPVLVITGLASDEEMREARTLGVSACIRKPFQVQELLEAAEKTLATKKT